MTITSIRQIYNNATVTIGVRRKAEKHVVLAAQTKREDLDMWIPWCNNQEELTRGESIRILDETGMGIYIAIWQRQDRIWHARYPGGSFDNATGVPGEWGAGGNKRLNISGNDLRYLSVSIKHLF